MSRSNSSADLSSRSRADKIDYLIYRTKWFTPLFYVIFFGLAGGIGLVWGLQVRSSHAPMADLPLYPNSKAVVDRSGETSPIFRPSTCNIPITRHFTNFDFQTNDSPEQVISYYKSALFKSYGFVGGWAETGTSDVQIFHAGRAALRSGESCQAWIVEQVDITATRNAPQSTKVTVDLRLTPCSSGC